MMLRRKGMPRMDDTAARSSGHQVEMGPREAGKERWDRVSRSQHRGKVLVKQHELNAQS